MKEMRIETLFGELIMNDYTVRLNSVEMHNFRNVENSKIVFDDSNIKSIKEHEASVTGLYGQNGSGKSTVIYAIEMLKSIVLSKNLIDDYADYLMHGKDSMHVTYVFEAVKNKKKEFLFSISAHNENEIKFDKEFHIEYTFFARKRNNKFEIYNEIIKYRFVDDNGEKSSLKTEVNIGDYFDNDNEQFNIFLKKRFKKKYYDLDEEIKNKIEKVRSIRSSFIFNYPNDINGEIDWMPIFIYGICSNMYSISTTNIGDINGKTILPIFIVKDQMDSYVDVGEDYNNKINLSTKMDSKIEISVSLIDLIKWKLELNNKFISAIIPNLKIEIVFDEETEKIVNQYHTFLQQNLNKEKSDADSDQSYKKICKEYREKLIDAHYNLYSVRNGTRILLKNEADGIRRLISLSSLIIMTYNNPNAIVVIDELDSGLFEYLLGEILSILSESAKGQFIFTSHNLRPLEVLRPKQIFFTTSNPNNRYKKFSDFSGHNNLRNMYYKKILLDENSEFYTGEDEYTIREALIAAGGNELFTKFQELRKNEEINE